MHRLSKFNKNYCRARILAERDLFSSGDLRVLNKDAHCLAGKVSRLALPHAKEAVFKVRGRYKTCFADKSCKFFFNRVSMNYSGHWHKTGENIYSVKKYYEKNKQTSSAPGRVQARPGTEMPAVRDCYFSPQARNMSSFMLPGSSTLPAVSIVMFFMPACTNHS